MKKSIIIVAVAALGFYFIFSGGDDEKEKKQVTQRTVPQVTKLAVPQRRNAASVKDSNFYDTLEKLNSSENRIERATTIARMGHVREEDRSETIQYLANILHNGQYQNERIAAAFALTKLGTLEAMKEVNEHLIYKKDRALHDHLVKELKKRFPWTHERIMTDWIADAFTSPDIAERDDYEIDDALSLYVLHYKPGCRLINVERFLAPEGDGDHAAKIYFLYKQFQTDTIPVDKIAGRIAHQFEARTLSMRELDALLDLMHEKRDLELGLKLTHKDIKWSVTEHRNPYFRISAIRFLGQVWDEMDMQEQRISRTLLANAARNDTYKEGEDVFLVRNLAAKVLKDI